MAKPGNSILVAVGQGQATGKGAPRGFKRLSNATALSTIDQDLSMRFIEEAPSSPSLSSQSRASSVFRSKSALSQTSIYSTRRKHSVHISRKVQRLNEGLHTIQIYKLKKQPIEDQVEIQPEPINAQNFSDDSHNSLDDAHNSVDDAHTSLDDAQNSLDDGHSSSKRDDDIDDDSEGVTSDWSSAKPESDFDQGFKERSNLLNSLRNIPKWDGLSPTTSSAQLLPKEDGRRGVFRENLDATCSIIKLEEASEQSEQDDEIFSVKESSKTDSEAHLSLESELESDDEADSWKVELPQVAADHIIDFTQVTCMSSSFESNYGDQQSKLTFSQTIRAYLYELVGEVVKLTERGEHRLRKRLDKHKLFLQLCALVEDDCFERDKNDYLISRLAGHYQQRQKYSMLTQDPTSTANEMDLQRYHSALNDLDNLLKKEQEAQKIYHTERDRLQAELTEKQSHNDREIQRLEDLIRATLLPHTHIPERLESVIDSSLRQMRNKRNLISETRLDLINKQHLDSVILQKLEEKEIIAEELTLHTYEATIEEVKKLDRRVTIMTTELQRLNRMFSNKVHTISHLRCRRKLLSRTFRLAKDELFHLEKKLSDLRAKLHQGHIMHNRLLAQIQGVRCKGGLMMYPLLMLDFDKTDQLVRDKRESISQLRAQHDNLLEKIEKVELVVKKSVSNSLQEH